MIERGLKAYMKRVPSFLRPVLPKGLWGMEADQTKPSVYITFDDGPHPIITPFVLNELYKYDAFATFFCLGNNVEKYPAVYRRILSEGHTVGNHTYDHPKLREVSTEEYIASVRKAKEVIDSRFFRPPYGLLNRKIGKQLIEDGYRIVYWSYLTGDFDNRMTPEQCLEELIFNVKPGDIIVFHDSEKAYPRLEYVLPRFLNFLKQKQWQAESLKFSE